MWLVIFLKVLSLLHSLLQVNQCSFVLDPPCRWNMPEKVGNWNCNGNYMEQRRSSGVIISFSLVSRDLLSFYLRHNDEDERERRFQWQIRFKCCERKYYNWIGISLGGSYWVGVWQFEIPRLFHMVEDGVDYYYSFKSCRVFNTFQEVKGKLMNRREKVWGRSNEYWKENGIPTKWDLVSRRRPLLESV
jgi:hypothetical protein